MQNNVATETTFLSVDKYETEREREGKKYVNFAVFVDCATTSRRILG